MQAFSQAPMELTEYARGFGANRGRLIAVRRRLDGRGATSQSIQPLRDGVSDLQ
jgi:hypothetical protein